MKEVCTCYFSWFVFTFGLTLSSIADAQSIAQVINTYGEQAPAEKIHIHFDKEAYLPGETIWFKAYLFEENLPAEKSTNFYAALYDEQGRMVQQQISPIIDATSDGHFDLPDSLKATRLICRAYTTWMLNFDTAFLYSRVLQVIGYGDTVKVKRADRSVSLLFFPEGGDVIEGIINTIAFKASYDNGQPFAVDGVIKKQESGEIIMPLAVLHDGMGKFDLENSPGEKYYAEWLDTKGQKVQTWLPEAKNKGISLKLSLQRSKLFYNLVNRSGNDSLHVLMYMYQKVFYQSHLNITGTIPYTGVVATGELPSGVLQVTVFDANWKPVAERIAFINNNKFSINADVLVTEKSFTKRGKNSINILIPDTIPANLSLSITDAELNPEPAENSIYSDLLLKGDLRGYIHNPAFYFSNYADPSLMEKLDLVMLTNGWRRYNWDWVTTNRVPSIINYTDSYLSLYGQVSDEGLQKMAKDESVKLMIRTKDSSNYFYYIKPDSRGFLKQGDLIFFDTAKVYFSFLKNRKLNPFIGFAGSNFTHVQPAVINNYKDFFLTAKANIALSDSSSLFKYHYKNYSYSQNKGEVTLKTFVVKTRRTSSLRYWNNTGLEKIDKTYSNFDFKGFNNAYGIDVLHDENAALYSNIPRYLSSKIPELFVKSNGDLGGGSTIIYGSAASRIYIDGQFDYFGLLNIMSLSEVAYIKFFDKNPDARAAPSWIPLDRNNTWTSAVVIYTRKGSDLIRDRTYKETNLVTVAIPGYTALKEFYSPDYSVDSTADSDARTTLLWMPYIMTSGNNRKVPVSFYNNDFTKKMRIVLEGINAEGKMIRIEKVIE